MTGKEFVRKVLDGEREFVGVRLEEGFNLSDNKELIRFCNNLKKLTPENRKKESICITNSEFRGLQAGGAYLPYLLGIEANLKGANFKGAIFHEANLYGANLTNTKFTQAEIINANLVEANFSSANLSGASIYGSDFRKANFHRTNVYGTNFNSVNFRDIKNLEHSVNLKYAKFLNTFGLEEEQRKIIQKKRKLVGG